MLLLAMVACVSEKRANVTASVASSTPPALALVPAWPAESVSVGLVDTTETEQYAALKVEVTSPGRVDTIPGVLTFDEPVITADGLIHGPTYTMGGDYKSIYSYNSRSREVMHQPLPEDAAKWDSEVKLSPDGRHIAYVGNDSTGSLGIVRTWPEGRIVLRTPSAPQPPGDYSHNAVRWENADSVEFSWQIDLHRTINDGRNLATAFVLTGVSVRNGTSRLDTLDQQPRLAR